MLDVVAERVHATLNEEGRKVISLTQLCDDHNWSISFSSGELISSVTIATQGMITREP